MNMNEKIENINIASTTFYLHFINAKPELDQLFKKTQIKLVLFMYRVSQKKQWLVENGDWGQLSCARVKSRVIGKNSGNFQSYKHKNFNIL